MVSELGESSSQIMEFFISLRVVSVARLKGFCGRVLQQTLEKVSKNCRFEFVCNSYLELDQSILHVLENALTHLIRNSIDHGIESPEDRTKSDKDPSGLLKLEITKSGTEMLRVELKDDGKGIDAAKLKSIVAAKGIFSAEALDSMSPEKAFELIFVDGLSPRTEVSDVSGRGVGMSAVKAEIEAIGGEIKIHSELGRGTTFTLLVPRLFKL